MAREDLLQATMEAQESASKAAVLEKQVKQLQVGRLRDPHTRPPHWAVQDYYFRLRIKVHAFMVVEGFLTSLDNTIIPICYLH